MDGIVNPVIIERTWRTENPITQEIFQADMGYAEQLGVRVYTWSGVDREGRSLVIVWVADPQTGQLFSAYEFTPGGE